MASSALSGPTERLKGFAPRVGAPALFLLDEFAALGRLEAVERAMGLMAGYGLQLWPILQDMGQETTGYQTESYRPGDPPSIGNTLTGRDLLTPDEIMQLRPENQLLRVQGQATAVAQKLRYFADAEFNGLYEPQDA